MQRRRRLMIDARASLRWALGFLLLIQAAVHGFLEFRRPEAYDSEYRLRLSMLKDRLAESPDRPLLLVIGSSRIATDFRPETLPELQTADGVRPLPFNFSHTGAGPLLNLMTLQRLLRQNIRPRWLVVEVLPPMLNISGRSTAAGAAGACDLPLLCRHMPSWKALGLYASSRLVPSRRHYAAVLQPFVPAWVLPDYERDSFPLEPLGGSSLLEECDAQTVRRRTAGVRAQYQGALQRFDIRAVADQAMRQLLDLCRAEGIPVVLLLTPEGSEFRSWYPPPTQRHIENYCAELSRTYAVPIVDARAWLGDSAFLDAHHAHPDGAAAFSQRLAHAILQPLVTNRLPLTFHANATIFD